VLHRDLKPVNIMLGNYGETLVVDWGLAKAGVRSPDADAAADETRAPTLYPFSDTDQGPTQAGAMLGTRGYVSPEQAAGRLDELCPPSDIYSLGATLYVLLTGRKPAHDAKAGEIDPDAQPRRPTPDAPPALVAISRKAMAQRPADRYQSALELAAEIEHWLADEPVSAYREPATARLARWTRRHQKTVASVAAAVVVVVAALGISTVVISAEQRETEKQRRIAVKNYEMSRKQAFEIIKLIETSEPEMASVAALHDRRRELLTTASEACRQFLEKEPDDRELQERAAQIYRYTANFHRLINEIEQAEQFYNESISLREKLLEKSPNNELLLADTLRDHAGLRIKEGRLREAVEKLNQSREIVERLNVDEKDPLYRRRLALLLRNLASIEYRQGKHETSDQTSKTLERATKLFRGLVDGPPQERHPYDPLLLASALNLTAMIARDSGKLELANTNHDPAIKLMLALRKDPTKTVASADVAYFMAEFQIEYCKTLAKTPKTFARAETNMGVAINDLFKLAKEYAKIPTYESALAVAFRERGELRLAGKNFKGARDHFTSAKVLLEALVKKYPALPGPRGELGRTYAGLAQASIALKDEDPAPWLRKAHAELRAALEKCEDDAQLKGALKKVDALRAVK
jgi:serine/threonine-protein kinase